MGSNGNAIHLWKKHYGEIPRKMVIHHVDGNHENNIIGNLRMMTMEDHCRLHHTGKVHSPEWNEAIRSGNLGIKRSAEVRKNMSEGQKGKKYTEATKQKTSDRMKRFYSDEEKRKAQSDRMKQWWADRKNTG